MPMRALLAAAMLLLASAPLAAGPKEDALMATDRAFAKMASEKGYDNAYLAFLAKDGQTFTGAHPIKGKSDAKNIFARNPDPGPRVNFHTWEPEYAGVSADGTLGWTEGRSSHHNLAGSGTGHYMTVWVSENGQWKVRADIGAPDPKPTP
jgi:hypothetical protein